MNTTHEGAIYLHGGRPSSSPSSTSTQRLARVQPFQGDWYTQPKSETDTAIEALLDRREFLGVTLSLRRRRP